MLKTKLFLLRIKTILADRVRYSSAAQYFAGCVSCACAIFSTNVAARIEYLAKAYRILLPIAPNSKITTAIEAKLIRLNSAQDGNDNLWLANKTSWGRYPVREKDCSPWVSHALVIKSPVSKEEKGVLVVWIEYNLIALMRSPRFREILSDYEIIFSTSWSPPDFPLLWAMALIPEADFWLISSNPLDAKWLSRVPNPLRVLPFFASHWIDSERYISNPQPHREYDLLMVSNWAPFKRHWVLFNALRSLPSSWRIAFVGQPEGCHTVEGAKRLAESFGVTQKIDWFNRIETSRVLELQASAHASLILSLREGSCLVLAECLFANTPIGLLRNAHVGSKAFICSETGMLLDEENLAKDLATLVEKSRSGAFQPREWALKHLPASRSSKELNGIMAEHSRTNGKPWTIDITPFCLRSARPEVLFEADLPNSTKARQVFASMYELRIG